MRSAPYARVRSRSTIRYVTPNRSAICLYVSPSFTCSNNTSRCRCGSLFTALAQMFVDAALENAVVRLVLRIDLQFVQPIARMRLAHARSIAPFVGDVGRDTKQITLGILDRDVVAIAQEAKKHFLRQVVDLGAGNGAIGKPAAHGVAPAAEPNTDAAIAALPRHLFRRNAGLRRRRRKARITTLRVLMAIFHKMSLSFSKRSETPPGAYFTRFRECACRFSTSSLSTDRKRRFSKPSGGANASGRAPMLFVFGKKGAKQQLFADGGNQFTTAHMIIRQRREQLISIVLAVQLS